MYRLLLELRWIKKLSTRTLLPQKKERSLCIFILGGSWTCGRPSDFGSVRWKSICVLFGNDQVLPSDPFVVFKWPFQGLSDLHLGYQKVTWKKLGQSFINKYSLAVSRIHVPLTVDGEDWCEDEYLSQCQCTCSVFFCWVLPSRTRKPRKLSEQHPWKSLGQNCPSWSNKAFWTNSNFLTLTQKGRPNSLTLSQTVVFWNICLSKKYKLQTFPSWWLNHHPFETYAPGQISSSSTGRDAHKQFLKPPPSSDF